MEQYYMHHQQHLPARLMLLILYVVNLHHYCWMMICVRIWSLMLHPAEEVVHHLSHTLFLLLCQNSDKESSGLDDMRLVQQLLESFASLTLSLPDVLPLIPPMRQRYYSISSSPAGPCGPRVASIRVGDDSPADNSHYQGLASGLLHNLMPGMPLDVSVASNDRFRLPVEPTAPVIMIGPGTGLAPFRGFLQELVATPRGPRSLVLRIPERG